MTHGLAKGTEGAKLQKTLNRLALEFQHRDVASVLHKYRNRIVGNPTESLIAEEIRQIRNILKKGISNWNSGHFSEIESDPLLCTVAKIYGKTTFVELLSSRYSSDGSGISAAARLKPFMQLQLPEKYLSTARYRKRNAAIQVETWRQNASSGNYLLVEDLNRTVEPHEVEVDFDKSYIDDGKNPLNRDNERKVNSETWIQRITPVKLLDQNEPTPKIQQALAKRRMNEAKEKLYSKSGDVTLGYLRVSDVSSSADLTNTKNETAALPLDHCKATEPPEISFVNARQEGDADGADQIVGVADEVNLNAPADTSASALYHPIAANSHTPHLSDARLFADAAAQCSEVAKKDMINKSNQVDLYSITNLPQQNANLSDPEENYSTSADASSSIFSIRGTSGGERVSSKKKSSNRKLKIREQIHVAIQTSLAARRSNAEADIAASKELTKTNTEARGSPFPEDRKVLIEAVDREIQTSRNETADVDLRATVDKEVQALPPATRDISTSPDLNPNPDLNEIAMMQLAALTTNIEALLEAEHEAALNIHQVRQSAGSTLQQLEKPISGDLSHQNNGQTETSVSSRSVTSTSDPAIDDSSLSSSLGFGEINLQRLQDLLPDELYNELVNDIKILRL